VLSALERFSGLAAGGKMSQSQKVWQQTRELLNANGLDWNGRPMEQRDHRQVHFERSMVKSPCGGQRRK
jgi:hypothetical protein